MLKTIIICMIMICSFCRADFFITFIQHGDTGMLILLRNQKESETTLRPSLLNQWFTLDQNELISGISAEAEIYLFRDNRNTPFQYCIEQFVLWVRETLLVNAHHFYQSWGYYSERRTKPPPKVSCRAPPKVKHWIKQHYLAIKHYFNAAFNQAKVAIDKPCQGLVKIGLKVGVIDPVNITLPTEYSLSHSENTPRQRVSSCFRPRTISIILPEEDSDKYTHSILDITAPPENPLLTDDYPSTSSSTTDTSELYLPLPVRADTTSREEAITHTREDEDRFAPGACAPFHQPQSTQDEPIPATLYLYIPDSSDDNLPPPEEETQEETHSEYSGRYTQCCVDYTWSIHPSPSSGAYIDQGRTCHESENSNSHTYLDEEQSDLPDTFLSETLENSFIPNTINAIQLGESTSSEPMPSQPITQTQIHQSESYPVDIVRYIAEYHCEDDPPTQETATHNSPANMNHPLTDQTASYPYYLGNTSYNARQPSNSTQDSLTEQPEEEAMPDLSIIVIPVPDNTLPYFDENDREHQYY